MSIQLITIKNDEPKTINIDGALANEVENLVKRQDQRESTRKILRDQEVDHFDPTYDKTFKWLMSSDNEDIARTIFDSMIFIGYRGLTERKVERFTNTSGRFDRMTEQLNRMTKQIQALMMDVSAELHLSKNGKSGQSEQAQVPEISGNGGIVESIGKAIEMLSGLSDGTLELGNDEHRKELGKTLNQLERVKTQIEGGKEDMRSTAEAINRAQNIMIDIEMQRTKQDEIEVRTLQYGAIMALSRSAKSTLPMLLVSICQWGKNGSVVKDTFHAVIGENKKKLSLSGETIYIQKPINPVGLTAAERELERKQIKEVFRNALRERYPELTNGIGSFKELWNDESESGEKRRQLRTAYEVLCFLRLAPLTPQLDGEEDKKRDKDPNEGKITELKQQGEEEIQSKKIKNLATRVFNPEIRRAYNLMNISNKESPCAEEQYSGVWGAKQSVKKDAIEKFNLHISILETVEQETDINDQTKVNIKANITRQWAQKVFSVNEQGKRGVFFKAIEERVASFGPKKFEAEQGERSEKFYNEQNQLENDEAEKARRADKFEAEQRERFDKFYEQYEQNQRRIALSQEALETIRNVYEERTNPSAAPSGSTTPKR